MRRLSTVLVVISVFCSPALAGPKEDALAVIDQWAAAFTASDVDAIVSLYAPDALFLGTGSRAVVTDSAGIRDYFSRALLSNRPRGAALREREVVVLGDDTVIVTGLDVTTGTRDGVSTSSPGRVTFVLARRPMGWRIVHFHRSAMPS